MHRGFVQLTRMLVFFAYEVALARLDAEPSGITGLSLRVYITCVFEYSAQYRGTLVQTAVLAICEYLSMHMFGRTTRLGLPPPEFEGTATADLRRSWLS